MRRRSNHSFRLAERNAWARSLSCGEDARSPALKALWRLVRRIRIAEQRARRPFYLGYSFNQPRVGDILVHLMSASGERRDLRINAWGAMRWRAPATFVHELFADTGQQNGREAA
jgi:hypothetical protein